MAPYELSGKYAVATGGGSGITLEFIKILLAKGCSVMVGDLTLRPEAQEVAAAYPHPAREPGKASLVFHKTNVTSWPQISSLWKTALATFPQVDLVVPGAGIYEPPASSFWYPPGVEGSPSVDDPEAEPGAYTTFTVNLIHPIRLAQLAVAYWTTNKIKGNLLMLGSIAGYIATISTPFYHSSKAGLHSFVRTLAPIHGRLGIRVACVAPGTVRTPLWDQEHCKEMLPPTDPALEPSFVAGVMLDLCTSDKYGNGEIVECIDLGTFEEPNPSRRDVPYHLLHPAYSGPGLSRVLLNEEKLWDKLKTEGFKA